MENEKFIDAIINGNAKIEDLCDYSDHWQFSNLAMPLREYLGILPEEYDTWYKSPNENGIREIVQKRMNN